MKAKIIYNSKLVPKITVKLCNVPKNKKIRIFYVEGGCPTTLEKAFIGKRNVQWIQLLKRKDYGFYILFGQGLRHSCNFETNENTVINLRDYA